MIKQGISLAALIAVLTLSAAPLDAIRIRIGSPDRHHHPHHEQQWWWNEREYQDYDDNFVFRGSSKINELESNGEWTQVNLENGMKFEINGTGLPFAEGANANVYSRRTSSGNTYYRLLIDEYQYPAERID